MQMQGPHVCLDASEALTDTPSDKEAYQGTFHEDLESQ